MKIGAVWTILAAVSLLPTPTASFVAPRHSNGMTYHQPSCALDMASMIQSSSDAATAATTTTITTATTTVGSRAATAIDEVDFSVIPNEPTITIFPESARYPAVVAVTAIAVAASNGWEVNGIPVAESMLALAASVTTVSLITAAVESVTAKDLPAFSLTTQRFDPASFGGRFCHMLLACDPRLLLYSEDDVRQYQALLLSKDDTYNDSPGNDRLLWEAKRIVNSALHPETDEWIPRAFRMSGYVPFNGPICVGMVASQSTLALLFFSWLNQSQNAMVNYSNRSASSQSTNEMILKSYATAVGSALLITFGLATFIASNFAGEEAAALLRFISFPSAVIASSLNCYVIRSPEIDAGIPLLDTANRQDVLPGQTSHIAAKRGVYSTTASRAILQFPTYFFPPLILDTFQPLKQYMCLNPSTVVPITTFVLLVVFGVGLPVVIGMLPQYSKIRVDEVEPQFGNLGCKEFYFDKGL